MTEKCGSVREVIGDTAVIEFEVEGACSGCQASCALAGAKEDRLVSVPARGLRAGDNVRLAVPSGFVINSAAIAYLVPALLVVAMGGVGRELAGSLGRVSADLGTMAGIILSLPCVAIYLRAAGKRTRAMEAVHVEPVGSRETPCSDNCPGDPAHRE